MMIFELLGSVWSIVKFWYLSASEYDRDQSGHDITT